MWMGVSILIFIWGWGWGQIQFWIYEFFYIINILDHLSPIVLVSLLCWLLIHSLRQTKFNQSKYNYIYHTLTTHQLQLFFYTSNFLSLTIHYITSYIQFSIHSWRGLKIILVLNEIWCIKFYIETLLINTSKKSINESNTLLVVKKIHTKLILS